jgi:large subunit ribosomal protein L22
MPGPKTNERPGTKAQARYVRMSATKARVVLDLIRDKEVQEAAEILEFVERDAAIVIRKLLASAVANAENNDGQDPTELFVSACFADEGPTLKRWRPRARGRATRIRKRTCHMTIIVSRLPEHRLDLRRKAEAASTTGAGRGRRRIAAAAASRAARVAKSRQRQDAVETHDHEGHDHDHEGHDHEHDDQEAVEPAGVIEPGDTESSAVTEDASAMEPAEGGDVVADGAEAEDAPEAAAEAVDEGGTAGSGDADEAGDAGEEES